MSIQLLFGETKNFGDFPVVAFLCSIAIISKSQGTPRSAYTFKISTEFGPVPYIAFDSTFVFQVFANSKT